MGWTITSVRKENGALIRQEGQKSKAGSPPTPARSQPSRGWLRHRQGWGCGAKPSTPQESLPRAQAVVRLGLTHYTWMPRYVLRFSCETTPRQPPTTPTSCGKGVREGWFCSMTFLQTLSDNACKTKDQQEQGLLNTHTRESAKLENHTSLPVKSEDAHTLFFSQFDPPCAATGTSTEV